LVLRQRRRRAGWLRSPPSASVTIVFRICRQSLYLPW
jgi:hypothetical protein